MPGNRVTITESKNGGTDMRMRTARVGAAAQFLIGLLVAAAATASEIPARAGIPDRVGIAAHVVVPPVPSASRAAGDTVHLMGGPDRGDGKFQDDLDPALPDREGWLLPVEAEPSHWHVDTFNAATLDPGQADNHAMWCGKYLPPCSGEPVNGGYGNSFDDVLAWSGAVPDPLAPTEVRITARLNHDTEPGYDHLMLEVARDDGFAVLASWDGRSGNGGGFVPVDVDVGAVVDPADYRGEAGDEIHLRWHFVSDGGISAHDCIWPNELRLR